MKKELASKYAKWYRCQNPEWITYLSINDRMKKTLQRIRDDAYGFRTLPLSQKDSEIKSIIESKLPMEFNWHNYGKLWNIKQPDLINKIRSGMTKDELLDANLFEIVTKSTNK